MEHDYKLIDTEKYREYDEISKGIFEYRVKFPDGNCGRESHNSFFAKRALWSDYLHISEYLGGIIGKRNNLKICDTELYVHPQNPHDYGVISYVHLSENDILMKPKRFILEYIKSQNWNHEYLICVDVDTAIQTMFWIMNKYRRPLQEFTDFKQDFIDMLIYDLKLLNPDRGLDNWAIRQDKSTNAIDLYPMFDNEMVLGFINNKMDRPLTDEGIAREDLKLTSSILTPKAFWKHKRDVDYRELFEYLLKKYPVQVQNSLAKFQDFTSDDLADILNSINEISDIRKDNVIRLFNARSAELDKIYSRNTKFKISEPLRDF